MDDHHQVAGDEEVAVDVRGDQLPDQTKITLRMMMMRRRRRMLMSVVISLLIKPRSL